MKFLGEIPVMKTTTIELTLDALAAFVNLVDGGVKAGGIQMVKPAALILPLLEQAQMALNEQGNGAMPAERVEAQGLGPIEVKPKGRAAKPKSKDKT